MPAPSALNTDQCDEFDRRGVLRLTGLLSADRVRSARERIQRQLAPLGLWRDGAWRPGDFPKPKWPDTGLKTSTAIGNKHPDMEALIEEPRLLAAVHSLLGETPFDRAVYKRPQVLFSLPNADAWTVPMGWHVDTPRLASGRSPGVQVFIVLDTVEPRGGGTLAVAGSHRLLNDGGFMRVKELRRRLREHAFFRDLFSETSTDPEAHSRWISRVASAGDVAVEVVEMAGAPGDVYLMDLRVLHASAPNASERPRLMATYRFMPQDVVRELAESFGWD